MVRARGAAAAAAAVLALAGCGTATTYERTPTEATAGTATAQEPSSEAATAAPEASSAAWPSETSAPRSTRPASESASDTVGPTDAGLESGGAPVIPATWSGTLLTEPSWPAPEGQSASTLLGEVLYEGQTRVEANDLSQMESTHTVHLGGAEFSTQCNQAVSMAQGAITCQLLPADPAVQASTSQLLLAPAPYAHSLLLTRAPGSATAPMTLPTGVPVILAPVRDAQLEPVTVLTEVAPAQIEQSLVQGALLSQVADGEITQMPTAVCTLESGGAQATCVLTGTPDGGADGVWHGALHSSIDGEPVMVFGRLPAQR